jgi:hypothetical protein
MVLALEHALMPSPMFIYSPFEGHSPIDKKFTSFYLYMIQYVQQQKYKAGMNNI